MVGWKNVCVCVCACVRVCVCVCVRVCVCVCWIDTHPLKFIFILTVSICIRLSSLICCLATHFRAQLYTLFLYASSTTINSFLFFIAFKPSTFDPHSTFNLSSWYETLRNFTKSSALSSGSVWSVREGSGDGVTVCGGWEMDKRRCEWAELVWEIMEEVVLWWLWW